MLIERRERIELFHLPRFSPEINPMVAANADLKRAMGEQPPTVHGSRVKNAIFSNYRRVQRQPERIITNFDHPDVNYAA